MRNPKRKNDLDAASRVIAYVRVSTERQANEGSSLEAQQARLASYAVAMDLTIVRFEVDAGVSASSLERPALQRALGALKAGEAGGLLVVKLDRLTRSVRDLLTLVDEYFHERSLLSISESIDTRSAAGRMLLKILTTIAEWEREAIGERTSAVMQHMKEQGQWTGGWPPFGYAAVDGVLVEDAFEQEIIARARALKREGMSLRRIAGELPMNPNTGRPFAASQVQRMCRGEA